MQLNVPNGPQPPQNPSMVQWNHCKYYSLDQRGQKPGDIYNPDTSAQASSTQLNSPLTSPTQSPTPSPVTSLNSVCTGLSPLPVLTQFPRPVGPAQGDGRYSLLGQPLQYNLSICPPPLLHNQSSYTAHQFYRGGAAKRVNSRLQEVIASCHFALPQTPAGVMEVNRKGVEDVFPEVARTRAAQEKGSSRLRENSFDSHGIMTDNFPQVLVSGVTVIADSSNGEECLKTLIGTGVLFSSEISASKDIAKRYTGVVLR
uniref:Uncharacterized protein n=1 Tax=Sphaerodactylus townsendi TaxID=933632 RepID=A0ACB8EN83_9SAUR